MNKLLEDTMYRIRNYWQVVVLENWGRLEFIRRWLINVIADIWWVYCVYCIPTMLRIEAILRRGKYFALGWKN